MNSAKALPVVTRDRFLLRSDRVLSVVREASRCVILIVEDDPSIRRLVKMVLEREGYNVEVASDGVEAVLKLGLTDYDVIILDLMMPNLDGFTFMSTLAAHDPERLKRIIVTSAASPAVIKERMTGTPFDVLPKPFDLTNLTELVKSCIESHNGCQ